MKPSFAIIGCGRVGMALAKFLAAAGYAAAGFSSRTLESARRTAEIVGSEETVFEKPWDAALNADIVFITTPDQLIGEIAKNIADHAGMKAGAAAFHCSGALPSTEIEALKSCGAVIGALHPLQSFAAVDMEKNPFSGIRMAVEGEPAAVDLACRIAGDLSAAPFEIRTEGKILYHASAVVASNYLVTLMHLARELMAVSGVAPSEAFSILKPLVMGTLENIESAGIPKALTGPIARGDIETVRRHLQDIADKTPELLAVYKMLGRQTIGIAVAKKTLSDADAGRLDALLSPSSGNHPSQT